MKNEAVRSRSHFFILHSHAQLPPPPHKPKGYTGALVLGTRLREDARGRAKKANGLTTCCVRTPECKRGRLLCAHQRAATLRESAWSAR